MIRNFALLAAIVAGSAWNLSQSLLLSVEKSENRQPAQPARAFIDGEGPGWVALTLDDFTNVNCLPETWSTRDGVIYCTGMPVGVTRSKKQFTNF